MNKVFIFDVDGTLTSSRQPMTDNFEIFFNGWSKRNSFYLVTGSDLAKTKEQVPEYLLERADGIFTCCGNQMWLNNELVYDNKFKPSDYLLKYLEDTLDEGDYPIKAGNHIEDRGSMLNFSMVGRKCTLQERKNYFEYDRLTGEREEIANYIKSNWEDLDAVIGGQISIDIYPKGNDKSQILKHIRDYINMDSHTKTYADTFEYVFIGDGVKKGGNDYPLAQLMNKKDNCSTFQTDGWEHTMQILENISD